MIFPVRCFTCQKVIAHKYEEYVERTKKETVENVLDDMGFDRYCCRRMFLSHVEIIDEVLKYKT